MSWNGDEGQRSRSPWGGSPNQAPPPDLDAVLRQGQKQFRRFVGGGGGGGMSSMPSMPNKKLLWIAGITIVVFWVLSGFYILQEEEQAVVLRFGRYVRTAGPGPNYHLPTPIEGAIKEKVTRVERMEIGFRSTGGRQQAGRATIRNVPEESLMLTGDENIANINFEVQWRIKNLENYVFRVEAPISTLKSGSESVMRELVGQSNIGEIQTTGRSVIEARAVSLLQAMMDNYETGVEIVSVNLLPIDPPEQVVDAFRKVQSAEAEKQTTINNATKQRNQILPVARGEAARIVQEAEAYKSQKVADAKGQASRFDAVYQAYLLSKDVTKKRLYLEMLEAVLPGVNKYVMDRDVSGSVLPHLALPTIASAGRSSVTNGSSVNGLSSPPLSTNPSP